NRQRHLNNYKSISQTRNNHLRRCTPLHSSLIIVGWPSGGGSVNSSVAGIQEMQYFLNTFPTAAKNADVTYYWFEGYDEPWKVIYDTATAQYEDKWVCFHEMRLIFRGC